MSLKIRADIDWQHHVSTQGWRSTDLRPFLAKDLVRGSDQLAAKTKPEVCTVSTHSVDPWLATKLAHLLLTECKLTEQCHWCVHFIRVQVHRKKSQLHHLQFTHYTVKSAVLTTLQITFAHLINTAFDDNKTNTNAPTKARYVVTRTAIDRNTAHSTVSFTVKEQAKIEHTKTYFRT